MREHQDNLGQHRNITLSRGSVVEQMLQAYLSDPDLIHHNLEVNFEHEEAVDVGGVTKEAFRLFWKGFVDKYCEGRLEAVPKVDHR